MLIRMRLLAIAAVCMFALGCPRFTDTPLIGTWRSDDGSIVEELSFNKDHSFYSVMIEKEVLSTPSSFEERGTWRIDGTELKIEAASVYTPNTSKVRTGVIDPTYRVLLLKTGDGTKTIKYNRFDLPTCKDGVPIKPEQSVREGDLVGSWKMHATTADYQLQLMPNGKLALLALMSPEWLPVAEGTWRVDGNRLITHSKRESVRADEDAEQTWIVTSIGKDCFSVLDAESSNRALVRMK